MKAKSKLHDNFLRAKQQNAQKTNSNLVKSAQKNTENVKLIARIDNQNATIQKHNVSACAILDIQ